MKMIDMNSGHIQTNGDAYPLNLASEHKNENRESLQVGPFFIVAASVRGKMHIRSETHSNRDDAFTIYSDGVWIVAAVSDGAGSRLLSRYGSAYSVNKFCSCIIEAIQDKEGFVINQYMSFENLVLEAFRNTRTGLDQFASQNGVSPADLHCTLLGLMLNTVTGELGIGHIGDGLILGLSTDRKAKPLIEPPDTGEVGVSYFLTQENWERYLSIKSIPGEETINYKTIYLMTDGVADDCQYGPPDDILQKWAMDIDREIRLSSIVSLEDAANKLKIFLNSYQASGSFDDRTLMIIFKKE
jgi:hypothetical protein